MTNLTSMSLPSKRKKEIAGHTVYVAACSGFTRLSIQTVGGWQAVCSPAEPIFCKFPLFLVKPAPCVTSQNLSEALACYDYRKGTPIAKHLGLPYKSIISHLRSFP